MSEIFSFAGESDFCPRGSIYPNPKETSLLLSLGSLVDVYFPPRKKSRVSAPLVARAFEQEPVSIDVLPDECLFEIFRRMPGAQERCACASVSKRWLNLLSSIHQDELEVISNKVKDGASKGDGEDDVESNGYLSRSLEGKKATDVRLAAIAVGTTGRGGLGKLSICGNNSASRVSDLGLRAIGRGCPSLRVLSLWNLSTISDNGLLEIAKGCSQLEKLDLCRCPTVTDKALVAIAKCCPNMSELSIESCSSIGNECLQAVAQFCPKLKSVSIKNCPLVRDQGIVSLLSKATYSLMKLKLQMLKITDVSLAVVGHYGISVADLVLSGLPNVSEKGFWVMGNGVGLQKLNSLTVTSCPGLTDMSLEAVGKGSPNLKKLFLSKCPLLSDNGLVSFAKSSSSVESLQLEECHRVTQFGFFGSLLYCGAKLRAFSLANCLGIRDLTTGLPVSSPCNTLRSLSIRNCPGFGDANLAALGKLCPRLQDVVFCGLNGITDSGLLQLVQTSQLSLVKVNLSGCSNLTDRVVSAISVQSDWTLEALNLEGCTKITDASLISIAENCQILSDLDVSNCAVTDFGVQGLASSNKLSLQILSLSGCSMVTDKSMPALGKLGRTLLGLNVQNCQSISTANVDLLIEQLWRCDILY
ncbi:PREDICTED: EIN3-binding F-box protein 1-like [Tarenaya hassleriana]|uniref:EIN3-binding F-box protein 1-like n=1 Tax=Tarenaya hassleriana TaxID=28532 RepID=UPI00053C6C73|nr:PREDICTED: EIN3-binding F-box protein 1-like [Tarenaya hassleriana]